MPTLKIELCKVLKSYNLVEITVRKAFDSVSHSVIHINNSVKQVDSLSLILINMVLNKLLHDLNNNRSVGTITPDHEVAAFAFVDDVILLEDHDLEM